MIGVTIMLNKQEGLLNEKVLNGDFLTLADLSTESINKLLANITVLKDMAANNNVYEPLKGKVLAMIFEKPSTRTRVSFETGMYQLGGHAIYLDSEGSQLGRGEPISDTAKVLSEYADAIMIRTFGHNIIEELAASATIPVINGLTDKYHPCQALADMYTILEHKKKLNGLRFVYVGDGNNVAHSLMIACAKLGIDCIIATPKGYEPAADVIKITEAISAETGCLFEIMNDPVKAVTAADVIYTDVWLSMGDSEGDTKLEQFKNFQVNDQLVSYAKSDYLFMHCLPAERGLEVSASVIDGDNSVVFQQAGNRLHAQKAILADLINK